MIALCITKRFKTVKYSDQTGKSGKPVDTRFYVLDCTTHHCAPSSDRIWLTPFAVTPLRVLQYLRSGMSGASRILSSSEISTQAVKCNVYRQGVQFEIRIPTHGNGFARNVTASSSVLSPSNILPPLLSFPQ